VILITLSIKFNHKLKPYFMVIWQSWKHIIIALYTNKVDEVASYDTLMDEVLLLISIFLWHFRWNFIAHLLLNLSLITTLPIICGSIWLIIKIWKTSCLNISNIKLVEITIVVNFESVEDNHTLYLHSISWNLIKFKNQFKIHLYLVTTTKPCILCS